MPLFKTIDFNATTQILIWKITESLEELLPKVALKEKTQLRLNGMKSEMHQRAFLSVRMLLQQIGSNDHNLHYDEFGKPYLNCGRHISITHSHDFAAIIISDDAIGIDIELQRNKIIRIADKFCDTEFDYLDRENSTEYIRKLTVIWGAKEAIFKIRNEKGISFKDHIAVEQFELTQTKTKASLSFAGLYKQFEIYFEEFEGFTLVYAF